MPQGLHIPLILTRVTAKQDLIDDIDDIDDLIKNLKNFLKIFLDPSLRLCPDIVMDLVISFAVRFVSFLTNLVNSTQLFNQSLKIADTILQFRDGIKKQRKLILRQRTFVSVGIVEVLNKTRIYQNTVATALNNRI